MRWMSTLAAVSLTAANLPLIHAKQCYALGYWGINSEGAGPGGTQYVGSQKITLHDDTDKEIGSYDMCQKCSGVCGDFIAIPTNNLPAVFEWGASCGSDGFTECHGAYGDQTHIDGEKPSSGTDFYGLGINAKSGCRVNFNC
ncbi:hypothetical protein N7492_000159 [Penicillium capsulatum]|uniref:Uncharacterized protein n=1 Tax=Penicillium capsulatum TaxID=69766 RepID=A0A9W9LYF6_9EURO|nr:hypothetical protein N7492_000159 [Penicillium capsulatum]KAJ6130776.1 hypothetical protein N7512_003556 [Penicillium capsulatum]